MPFAARTSDPHACPLSEGPKPHLGGTLASGEVTVLIGFQPAARVGDTAPCLGSTNLIVQGEPSVLIGDAQAARQGDATAHGGKVMMGCPTVVIGSSLPSPTLRARKPQLDDLELAPLAASTDDVKPRPHQPQGRDTPPKQ